MPLVHRTVTPVKLSSAKLNLSKADSEFFAVNNGSLVSILRQLSSLVTHAGDIFAQVSIVAGEVGFRIQSIKLRLDELEAKVELFDPKLVPVPEGTLDDEPISHQLRPVVQFHSQLFLKSSRPPFLIQLYDKTGKRIPQFPLRSPVLLAKSRHNANSLERNANSRRPASIAALRDWKLDDYVDEKLTTLERRKKSTPEELNQTVSGSFGPTQVVQVDVTGSGFDRMKSNRRSLTIHTKRIRSKKKRRNTICGAMPNKECGIQTSFSSVLAASDHKKYGIDSGHWSSCTTSGVGGASSTSAPSPWDPNSITTSSDFLYDDEDRSLTPQLENFTDGLVSDSDCSVDSAGFFTSFRNDCGFPKSKKAVKDKEDATITPSTPATATENEYELFGKGSTSTTASSCGTVVLRRKPDGAEATIEQEKKGDDVGWEERVKRKSLIEVVPSMVVVTPSPSCSLNGGSPPPLKEPEHADMPFVDEDEGSSDDRLTPRIMESDSESGTLSDNDDPENRRLLDSATPPAVPPDIPPREPHLLITSDASSSSSCSSNTTVSGSSSNNGKQEEQERSSCGLPKPDVIPDVQQLQVIRTSTTPKLKSDTDYVSLDTVQLECRGQQNGNSSSSNETLDDMDGEAKPRRSNSHERPGVSARIRGAKVVLDPNGEIIFSSETLKRKRRQKISFDPGASVKPTEYDSKSSYNRVRESIYDRLRTEKVDNEIYECIEKIRQHNLKESDAIEKKYDSLTPLNTSMANGSPSGHSSVASSSPSQRLHSSALPSPSISMILETDLDNLPPVMPELETLPKIKDRLKRNESYRMANEELALRPALSIHNRQLNGLNGHKSSTVSAAANRKRDIPEEDPVFVQQILSLSSSTNSLSRNSPIPSTNHHSLFGRASSSNSNHNTHSSNHSLVLSPSSSSKFALSPDDRPSFLRRESPPSVDSITKEIYRFRKKFNIQPNASSASLLRSAFSQKEQKPHNSSSDLYAQILPKSSRLPPAQNEKKVPPSTPLRSIFNYTGSPLSTSTPIRSTAVTSKPVSGTQCSALLRQPFFGRKQVYSSLKQSGTKAFEDPKKDRTTKSVTFQFPKMAPGTPGIAESNTGVAGISYSVIKSPDSASETKSRSSNSNTASHRNPSGTSLNDFKKLLQATRASSVVKKSPISAMEILKPKVGNTSSGNSSSSSSSANNVETTL